MAQFGFDTGIVGVNRSAIPTIAPRSTEVQTIGKLHPKTSDDDNMVLLAVDTFTKPQSKETADELVKTYVPKMSKEGFDNAMNIIRDVSYGSGKEDLEKGYPYVTKDVIGDIYNAYDSIKNPKKEPGVITNLGAGILSQIPVVAANLIASVFKEKPFGIQKLNPSHIFPNTPKEMFKSLPMGGTINDFIVQTEPKEAKTIKELGEKARQEVTKFIGGDEESKMYKIGQITTEVAPFFIASSVGTEKFGSAVLSKAEGVLEKLPNLKKFITNPFVQKIVQRSIASIPATEATTMGSEGRYATPGELLGGMAINTLIPGGSIKKIRGLKSMVGEQQGAKDIAKGIKRGNLEDVSRLKKRWKGIKIKVTNTPRTKAAIDTIKKEIPNFSANPAELLNQIAGKMGVKGVREGGKIAEVSTSYGNDLAKVNIATMTKAKSKLANKLNTLLNDASDTLTPSVKKNAKLLVNKIKNAKNNKEIREANKEFNLLMPDSMKSGLSKGKDQLLYKTRKPLQEDINKFIDDTSTSQGVIGTADKRKIIADLLHAKKQLGINLPTLLKTVPGMKYKLGKGLKTVAKLWLLGKILGSAGTEKTGVAE